MGRLAAVVFTIVLLAACQSQTHAVFSPAPSPSPHTLPTVAILQSADVPAGLNVCLGSGPIDAYLSTLATANASLAATETQQWAALQKEGAKQGAVSVFTSDPKACNTEFGAAALGKAVWSFVAEFGDEGQADRAWHGGVFGFAPPAPGQVNSGLSRGKATGLGLSSFTYERPSVRLACWRRSVFVALVVVSNLDGSAFHAATGAVDPRLN